MKAAKRLGIRIACGMALFLLWLAVAILAVEAGYRWRRYRQFQNNPHIQRVKAGAAWHNDPSVPGFPESGHCPPGQPLPDDLWQKIWRQRLSVYASLNERDRALFGIAYGKFFYLYARDGILQHRFPLCMGGTVPTPADEESTNRFEEHLKRTADTGAVTKDTLTWVIDRETAPLRTVFFPLPGDDGTSQGVGVGIGTLLRDLPEDTLWEHPFFIYRAHAYRPYSDTEIPPFFINNFGFRDCDLEIPKPPHTFRILCLGASTTEEGDYNSTTYPNLLENMLKARYPGHRIEVVNAGISGQTAFKQRLRIPDYFLMDPDIIVYYAGVNDLCYGIFQNWIDRPGMLRRLLRQSRLISDRFNRWMFPMAQEADIQLESFIFRNLREISSRAKEHNIPFFYCSFAYPRPEMLDEKQLQLLDYLMQRDWGGRYVTYLTYVELARRLNEAIRRYCRTERIHYVPVAEEMPDSLLLYGDICHMNDPGREAKAAIIKKHLVPFLDERLGSRQAAAAAGIAATTGPDR